VPITLTEAAVGKDSHPQHERTTNDGDVKEMIIGVRNGRYISDEQAA
jgi:hypothetical protein